MGNTSSNPAAAANAANPQNTPFPVRLGSPAPPSPNIQQQHRVHRSLRSKKKSLELPDLASLSLTPASSSPSSVSPHPAYRRPPASSPIPIPTSANPPQPTFRPQNNLPSAAHIHMHDGSQANGHRPRHKSYLSSAYPSTRSFISGGDQASPPREEPIRPVFVPEVVYSTLPLALVKAEEETKLEPVAVKIIWRGGGKSVVLARAGDDNWQGRQPMDFDPQLNQWFTYVPLLPGTHHLKFIVDDQWKTADEYPTASDDRDGSLANYVAVPFPAAISSPNVVPASGSGSCTTSPLASPHHSHPNQFNSFWSDASSAAANGVPGHTEGRGKAEAEWTTTIPPELVAAAAEEETYLASADSPAPSHSSVGGGGVPAPNIPPAPVLPRHLDKLILNVRPAAVTAPTLGASERDRGRRGGRERERSRRDKDSRARPSNLGMTSSAVQEDAEHPASLVLLPVVTASGTDLTAGMPVPLSSPAGEAKGAGTRLEATSGVADDASVLPVPSHVVLHHLSTSAIRNGVLAIANTTRYKKKYITTIYYKPT
ncbi:carbohydrate-binding module family 48 protein [Sparassis crispa]|uniref:Carbohydrate-binding module family 48 protein n=1 Tax=Sparassis crispa TaxID=139825 RepID=A0A401GSD8_9APHY|nr:carbohydrate-binding module family 48 protein [Sparassis crispa]GBE85126.1 carbohydrate-binding module family 48 protein [Sparassis crispa]